MIQLFANLGIIFTYDRGLRLWSAQAVDPKTRYDIEGTETQRDTRRDAAIAYAALNGQKALDRIRRREEALAGGGR